MKNQTRAADQDRLRKRIKKIEPASDDTYRGNTFLQKCDMESTLLEINDIRPKALAISQACLQI